MIQLPRTPLAAARVTFILILFVLIASPLNFSVSAQRRRGAAAAKAKSSRDDKRRHADKGREKSARADKKERDRKPSAKDKKSSAKEQRLAKKDRNERADKGGRAQSRRERLAEARRQAEQRRREAIEAARRAEIARQAAIARQRALEQAMRDEAVGNILRDSTAGEDLEVRRAAVAALGHHAGTVVVMNPKTGQVYTVVNQEWGVRRGFKPCSTIKLVTGLAGLTEKVIDPSQTFSAASYAIDLTDSLAYSNNPYFQSVGGRVGFDKMVGYARELGLGERTGINYPLESSGRVPVFKSGWAVNRMSSHGDDFEVTPVQLASMVSAIANGGDLLVPHLPRTPEETIQFKKEVRRKIKIPTEAMQRILPGMIGAVNYGSGRLAYDPTQTIAGKTGTCIGQGSWVGLFTSFAPVVDPKLAVVVVTRGPDARGHFPAAVAGRIYRSLNYRFGTRGQVANTPANLIPHPKINPKAASKVIGDEDEADTTMTTGTTTAVGTGGLPSTDTLPGGGSAPRTNNTVKSVIMTVPPRQTEVTTRPAQTPQQNSQKPGQQPEKERPRRVLTNQP
ncbi:MAG TPA: penicillin-binding transpeptidase domain-containing protein [Pyrinomonadaceae bacterium]|jgi:membrane peptidoglycan carboxypeptidase